MADASPIPVLLYNMPANTGVSMPANIVCELACHPNIAGIKNSSGNIVQIAEIVANTPVDFPYLPVRAVSFWQRWLSGA